MNLLRFLELKREIERLELELDALAEEIKSAGVNRYDTTAGVVSVTQVAGRKTVDYKTLIASLGVSDETVAAYTKPSAACASPFPES